MGRVVSLGSINVDGVWRASEAEIAALADRYDWFPERGQTVRVEDIPEGFAGDPDRTFHGGKGANQAVAAASAGAETTLLGKVGPDHGRYGVLDALSGAGVGVDRVGRSPEPTGRAYVFVGPDGDNWIVVRAGANGDVDRAYVRAQYDAILAADCLLLQNEIPVDPVADLLSELASEPDRPTVVLDPAPAAGAGDLLGHGTVDYLTPNEREYEALGAALDAFDGTLVRKHGSEDVVVETDDGGRFAVTPPRVRPVDTTGAGDVMEGFLGARLAAGDDLIEAVGTAVVAASLSTREEGARGGIPTLDEVRAFRAEADPERGE
ncbi:MAG: PfkB family carbohydrate kinase [Haloarculaceae archaeon]